MVIIIIIINNTKSCRMLIRNSGQWIARIECISFSKGMLLLHGGKKDFSVLRWKNMASRLHFVETVHIAACTSGRISRCLISRIETAAVQCFCCKYKTAPRGFQSITCCLLCGAHPGWQCGTAPFLASLQLHNAAPSGVL